MSSPSDRDKVQGNKTKRITVLAVLLGIGVALHALEALIPFNMLPGMKLGFANIVTLVTLYVFGFSSTLTLAVLRVLMGSLLSGTFMSSSSMLALSGAICQEPDIIILDEPTSFLDIKHKLDLLSILRDMAKKKQITVIMSLHEIDLAQKIADKIICVKGDTISHFGKPEDIFEENMIKELYEINNGFFDPLFGSIELPKPDGEAKTFVICGNGTGIPIFRQLQKEHTPFIAGILYTNDVDYRLARLLASKVITEEPFMEISEEAFQKAQKAMKSCERIICTAVPVGSCNKRLGELIDAAKKSGKTEFV